VIPGSTHLYISNDHTSNLIHRILVIAESPQRAQHVNIRAASREARVGESKNRLVASQCGRIKTWRTRRYLSAILARHPSDSSIVYPSISRVSGRKNPSGIARPPSRRMLHFVDQSHTRNASAKRQQRRAARSHSARAVHRETRRRETIQHQSKHLTLKSSVVRAHGIQCEPMTSLRFIGALPAGRKDPFMSFVRPFKPIEHFLLDHCRFSQAPRGLGL